MVQTRRSIAQSQNPSNNNEEEKEKQPTEKSKTRLHSTVEDLHAEMEIAEYATNRHGQNTRKISRRQSKERTSKRKVLEKKDRSETAILSEGGEKKNRLRGSKLAFEDQVVNGSLIFGADDNNDDDNNNNNNNSNNDNASGDHKEDDEYIPSDDVAGSDEKKDVEVTKDDDGDYEMYADELNLEDYDAENDPDELSQASSSNGNKNRGNRRQNKRKRASNSNQAKNSNTNSKQKGQTKSSSSPRPSKAMFRLRNFKSHRMAQRHGAALGAHAQGLNRAAVSQLKEVASAVPIAPQVYSSLGLVYESILQDDLQKQKQKQKIINVDDGDDENGRVRSNPDSESKSTKSTTPKSPSILMKNKVEVAEKAFASYHVAAHLCRLDHSLWIRVGNAALAIAHLHKECLALSLTFQIKESIPKDQDDVEEDEHENNKNSTSSSGASTNVKKTNKSSMQEESEEISTKETDANYHQEQKQRWFTEAKDAYITADNLRPPGITVPAKLAYVHMELGNLSEALTILTDIKKTSKTSIMKRRRRQPREENCKEDGSETEQVQRRSELDRSYSAWMLYADLMLKIGHECIQWNRGNESNNNYMFRRWLRKYAATFDWRERRLQALCMALEAAGGSESCEKVVTWAHDRARDKMSKANANSKEKEEDQNGEESFWQVEDAYELDNEKTSNAKGTESNNKNSSSPRRSPRARGTKSSSATTSTSKGNIPMSPLPMSASCASVTDICSQLLKLCLGMELYQGGKLVAEALSSYMRQRALRHEARMKQQEMYEKKMRISLDDDQFLTAETYDDIDDESDFSDDEDVFNAVLSDDEDFKASENSELVQIMKNGILPEEIQVLYALCLIGYGNFNFLAGKLLQSLTKLEERGDENIIMEGCTSDEISWTTFQDAMVRPIQRLAAFSLCGDVLHKIGKEKEWAPRLQHLFECQLEEITEKGDANIFLNQTGNDTASTARGEFKKILLATSRMRLYNAESCIDTDEGDATNGKNGGCEAATLATSIINSIVQFHELLFDSVFSNGSLDATTIEVLRILSESLAIILKVFGTLTSSSKRNILSKVKKVVSWICRDSTAAEDDNLSTSGNQIPFNSSWCQFPISSQWQSAAQKAISTRAFNLGVACNVAGFSGWESEEFSLKLLKRKRGQDYFGVSIRGDRVAGYLSPDVEEEISEQWEFIESAVSTLPSLDYQNKISRAKRAHWYKTSIENMKQIPNFIEPFIEFDEHGEKHALKILTSFSRLSLLMMKNKDYESNDDSLLMDSFSIILPLTQFALDENLWTSPLGKKTTKENDTFNDWETYVEPTNDSSKPSRSSKSSSKKPYRPSQAKANNNLQSFAQEPDDISPLTKLVKVPATILLKEWTGKDVFSEDTDDDETYEDRRLNKWSQGCSGSAKLAMKKLDYSIQKLRQCFTINALQKASTQVAMALVEVAGQKECHNPFLCLHQAAIFSSHGSKGGNNDEGYKKQLPVESECTPQEALNILGRADCLRAIHFTNESMFLCSYVSKICRFHRDKNKPEFPWTPKWRVIGIYMYTVCLSLDATIHSLMEGDERDIALRSWDSDVKAEIGRARSDAIAVKRAMAKSSLSIRNNAKELSENSQNSNSPQPESEVGKEVVNENENETEFMNLTNDWETEDQDRMNHEENDSNEKMLGEDHEHSAEEDDEEEDALNELESEMLLCDDALVATPPPADDDNHLHILESVPISSIKSPIVGNNNLPDPIVGNNLSDSEDFDNIPKFEV